MSWSAVKYHCCVCVHSNENSFFCADFPHCIQQVSILSADYWRPLWPVAEARNRQWRKSNFFFSALLSLWCCSQISCTPRSCLLGEKLSQGLKISLLCLKVSSCLFCVGHSHSPRCCFSLLFLRVLSSCFSWIFFRPMKSKNMCHWGNNKVRTWVLNVIFLLQISLCVVGSPCQGHRIMWPKIAQNVTLLEECF